MSISDDEGWWWGDKQIPNHAAAREMRNLNLVERERLIAAAGSKVVIIYPKDKRSF